MCLQVYPLKEYASGLTHEQMLPPTTKQDNFTFHSPLPKSQIGFCNCILKPSMQYFLELLCVKDKTVHVRTEINKNKKHVITMQFCPIFAQVLAQSYSNDWLHQHSRDVFLPSGQLSAEQRDAVAFLTFQSVHSYCLPCLRGTTPQCSPTQGNFPAENSYSPCLFFRSGV